MSAAVKSGRGLLLASALVAIVSGYLLYAGLDPADPVRPAPPAEPAAAAAPATAPRPPPATVAGPGADERRPAPPPSSGPPDILAGPVDDEQLNQAVRESHPSNLDEVREDIAVAVATAALKADLTGKGRERFPEYLPGPAPPRTYSHVRIQAAVAQAMTRPRGNIEVTLMWAGVAPDGRRVERETATIQLQFDGDEWQPVPP